MKLEEAVEDVRQAAREVYYAMTFLPDNHPARANLRMALVNLGVSNPGEVGLSTSVLRRRSLPLQRSK